MVRHKQCKKKSARKLKRISKTQKRIYGIMFVGSKKKVKKERKN